MDEARKPWSAEDLPDLAFAVFGAGRSGIAAARALSRRGAKVLLADDHPRPLDEQQRESLEELGVELVFGGAFSYEDYNLDGVVVSPGIPLSHELVKEAERRDLSPISELECGSRLTDRPMVAITGTNGKTTTTALLTQMLNTAGQKAIACGNIGVAFCDVVDFPAEELDNAVLVVEVSSFQLELIETFHPVVAVILNLTPDHLDRHGSMDDYLAVKARVSMNQTPNDALVLNADDIMVWRLARNAAPRVWGFSRRFQNDPGVNVSSSKITIHQNGRPTEICKINEIQLPGRHNEMNALAGTVAAWILETPAPAISAAIASFEGVEHRNELVNEFRGVRFINDSKATNLDAMEVALHTYDDPVILICGGRDKGGAYAELAPLIKERAKRLVVFGEAAPKIIKAYCRHLPLRPVYNLEQAVERSFDCAEPGDVVLFSPACSSFDMYKSFEERGRDFKRCVNEFIEEQKLEGVTHD
jgi:UDP-N-acetylmuramoylalanine--D-glutamate ligase